MGIMRPVAVRESEKVPKENVLEVQNETSRMNRVGSRARKMRRRERSLLPPVPLDGNEILSRLRPCYPSTSFSN